MKTTDRQRIVERLQEIDAWRASGMGLKAYTQALGQSLATWRARLRWEVRWRNLLADEQVNTPVAFVKATAAKAHPTKPVLVAAPEITITLETPNSALRAKVSWPVQSGGTCAAWLREVLA